MPPRTSNLKKRPGFATVSPSSGSRHERDIARIGLASTDVERLVTSLEILGTEGKLTDLQPMLVFAKHADQRVGKTAVLACSNLIRNNLIVHFHDLGPAVRQKLRTVMETLVPQVIDEIAKDL